MLIVFELASLFLSLRLSIGYELYMNYPCFSMYFYSRSVVVLYLTIFTFVPFLTYLKCSHVSEFVSTLMPVTTRSQSRRSRGIDGATLEVSSAISSSLSSNTTFVNIPSQSSFSVPTSVENSMASNLGRFEESIELSSSHVVDSVVVDSYHCSNSADEFSKFQNVEISNYGEIGPATCNHNLSVSNISIKSGHGITDMNSLFKALSNKLMSETTKISREFQKVTVVHDRFKQEVRDELDELRRLVLQGNHSLSHPSNQVVPDMSQSSSSRVSLDNNNLATPIVSPELTSVSSQDMQTMMMMMTESYSKLSTAFAEDKSDPKSEWPKFSGEAKKFWAWYLGIMTQLSLPPWLELYDSSKHNIVESTSNSSLNGKLYSKIVLALEGPAYKNFISRKHLRANGLLFLQEMVQTYKPRNVPEIITAKTVEFWGSMKRLPSESIDSYYD